MSRPKRPRDPKVWEELLNRALERRDTGPDTIGTINGAKCGVYLPENSKETKEWIILGQSRVEFADMSHSDAWVINDRYELIGMITDECLEGWAYMTPINLLPCDIEEQANRIKSSDFLNRRWWCRWLGIQISNMFTIIRYNCHFR